MFFEVNERDHLMIQTFEIKPESKVNLERFSLFSIYVAFPFSPSLQTNWIIPENSVHKFSEKFSRTGNSHWNDGTRYWPRAFSVIKHPDSWQFSKRNSLTFSRISRTINNLHRTIGNRPMTKNRSAFKRNRILLFFCSLYESSAGKIEK